MRAPTLFVGVCLGLVFLGALLAPRPSSAEEQYLCTITATSGVARQNSTGFSVCPTLLSSGKYTLQCGLRAQSGWTCVTFPQDGGSNVRCLPDAGYDPGIMIPPKQFYDFTMKRSTTIAVYADDGGIVDCDLRSVNP